MSELPNISQNNEQILNDIQSLQQTEQSLFNNLETNTNLTPQQQQQIIEKMNQLTNMRINLYQTLSGINDFFNTALKSSVGTLNEQTAAVSIVENELNRSKKRLERLETEKMNKIRLVEINDYYGDKYAEHSQLMKIVIFILVPVIVLAFLNNKGILPTTIFNILIVIISIIGGFFFWRRFSSMIMRDNMNYQEYNFPFNPETAPDNTTTDSSSSSDPWKTLKIVGSCVGENCCSEDQYYDVDLNLCVLKANNSTTPSTTTSTTTSTTESFITESMVNDILIKKQPGKYKDDVNIGNIQHSQSKSFINS